MDIHCYDRDDDGYLERLTEEGENTEHDPALFEGFGR
jgi:hypothetical protein